MPRRKSVSAVEATAEAAELETAGRGNGSEPAPAPAGRAKARDDGRLVALERALGDITKRFGDGAIMRLGEATHMQVDVVPTGSVALDLALGVGGIPRGRVTEIYGPESAGKTTLCQHIVAEAQRAGGLAAYIDMEHALDPAYARRCGADIDNLYIAQPDTGEQALEIAEALIRSGAFDVLVIDSVAALVPRAEIEGEMGDAHMGLHARLMSQALRKLSGAVKHTNTALVFTNQLRMKIGVMFGNPETTTGGMALKFYASVRLDIRRIQQIKDSGGEVIGSRTKVRVTKNKVAPPFREAEFDIMYNEGISREGDVIDLATTLGIVVKRGAFFSYGDMRLGQGRENAKAFLRGNAELREQIVAAIREQTIAATAALPPTPGANGGGGYGAGEDEDEEEDEAPTPESLGAVELAAETDEA